MSVSPQFTRSTWFATVLALLVALGTQVLIGSLLPLFAFEWPYEIPPMNHPVLIAGETSFWRVDALIRAMSFAMGAFIAHLLAKSHSWQLLASLVAISIADTFFEQFPMPATPWQLGIWASAAPAGALLVGVLFQTRKTNA
jgi:hypothetical protein